MEKEGKELESGAVDANETFAVARPSTSHCVTEWSFFSYMLFRTLKSDTNFGHPGCLLAGLRDPSLFCIKPFLSLSLSRRRPPVLSFPAESRLMKSRLQWDRGRTDADVRHAPVVTAAAQIRADGFGRKRLPSMLRVFCLLAIKILPLRRLAK